MIRNLVVLGAGSAGLIAALTLRRFLPRHPIRVVRSPDLGVIGVGEGTTRSFPDFLINTLQVDPARFYAEAQPTWKLGIRFFWGPRERFFYTFSKQFNHRWGDLARNNGFYCDREIENVDLWSGLMAAGRAFPRMPNGQPDFAGHTHVGFHVENKKLVGWLEEECRRRGIEFTDGKVANAEMAPEGDRGEPRVTALHLDDGQRVEGDFFVDASGFRSEMLGGALEEPYIGYDSALFCDRAVIGGWPRTTEPVLPYTTCETMDAGWCWQIEHEHWINRGYVYSSRFMDDDTARAELVRKNPLVAADGREPRVVKFRTGRYRRMWVGNVVGIGNSSGFVEPLEATALAVIVTQSRSLAVALCDSLLEPSASVKSLYNRFITTIWDEVKDFIALHYRFNTRLDTPFWRHCQNETGLGSTGPLVEFYRENGPSAIHETAMISPDNSFGMEGYLAMLVGQRVPHARPYVPAADEQTRWERHRSQNAAAAATGLTVGETLAAIRQPTWRWNAPAGRSA